MKAESLSGGSTFWLVTFGDSYPASGKMDGAEIYEALMRSETWYLSREVRMAPGDTLVFYENGCGFRGYAKLLKSGPLTPSDRLVLREYGVEFLVSRLELKSVVRFKRAVPIQHLVADLSFITNKKHIGLGLRSAPRRIPAEDFARIRQAGKRSAA